MLCQLLAKHARQICHLLKVANAALVNPTLQLFSPKWFIHVLADNAVDVDAYFADNANAKAVQGTIGDDSFTVNGDVAGKTIDGLGGDDTVHLHKDATTGTVEGDDALHLRNVENVMVHGEAEIHSEQLLDIELAKGATSLNVDFAADAVAGSDDELDVKVAANEAALTVNGIENLDITATGAVSALNVTANEARGQTMCCMCVCVSSELLEKTEKTV